MSRTVAPYALLLVVPLLGLEVWVRLGLFRHVSYASSASIDRQWRELGERDDWDILAVGDSEVRWAIDPVELDLGIAEGGLRAASFNLGWDGFSGGIWGAVLPRLELHRRAPSLKVLLVGVQLIEGLEWYSQRDFSPRLCGELQRPVLTSALARDHGLARLCKPDPGWVGRLVDASEAASAVVRYRSNLRSFLLPSVFTHPHLPLNGATVPGGRRGWEPHRPMRNDMADFERELGVHLAQRSTAPALFEPLPPHVWERMTADGGYFDQWLAMARQLGAEPAFFALPTNPVLVDAKNRRRDYRRHGELLAGWATRRGVTFVDLGLQDDEVADWYYSDFRHLSIHGATKFSRELGQALARDPAFQRALSAGPKTPAAAGDLQSQR